MPICRQIIMDTAKAVPSTDTWPVLFAKQAAVSDAWFHAPHIFIDAIRSIMAAAPFSKNIHVLTLGKS